MQPTGPVVSNHQVSPPPDPRGDVHIAQRHPSPRFAKAYELLRRREEMKRLPDPSPPRHDDPASSDPEPASQRPPVASPRPARHSRGGRSSTGRGRRHADDVDVTEDDFTSDAFSDVSAPLPSSAC